MSKQPKPIAERFWPKVAKGSDDECWMWQAAINTFTGYGQIYNGKTMSAAHRVAYELVVGPIPDRMTIDHTCNVRTCVNPAHLRPCTTQANTQAAKERRTTCRRGHPIADNTYISPRGERRCRACNTERHSEYMQRTADRLSTGAWDAAQAVADARGEELSEEVQKFLEQYVRKT